MVTGGRGILAADESIGTMNSRLQNVGVEPTETNRRDYRELLVTTADLADGVSGVILCEETFRQRLSDGRTFPEALAALGILAGIKVDTGAKPLAGRPGETITEGLDALDGRLAEFAELGGGFAKWRAVITIDGTATPTPWAIEANAHALARYAASCQQAGIVPIVEPEVLMDGPHSADRCAEVTATTLTSVFAALDQAGVDLAGIVLKPNMVVTGATSGVTQSPDEVARMTVDALLTAVPPATAGVAFLSGGQPPEQATANLAAMQALEAPWPLTFSFGRALVDPALRTWRGVAEQVATGQAALAHHVGRNAAAVRGELAGVG
jgi:fructose-bisphosphate aldolase class I